VSSKSPKIMAVKPRRAPLAVVIMGLLTYSVVLGSARLDGLGPDLSGIIDDRTTDVLAYPQLNAFRHTWLADVDAINLDRIRFLLCKPGRLSVVGAVDADLLGLYAFPTASVALGLGSWTVGSSFSPMSVRRMPARPYFWVPGDTDNLLWSEGTCGPVGDCRLGASWTRPGITLDLGLYAAWDWWVGFVGVAPDTFMRTRDGLYTHLSPDLRISIRNDRLCGRFLASLTRTLLRQRQFDTYGDWVSRTYFTKDGSYDISAGLTYTLKNLVLAAGLRHQGWLGDELGSRSWTRCLFLPVCLEWSRRPIAVRAGAEVWYGNGYLDWRERFVPLGLQRSRFYWGLGLNPTRHLRFDFSRSNYYAMSSARAWEIAASYEF